MFYMDKGTIWSIIESIGCCSAVQTAHGSQLFISPVGFKSLAGVLQTIFKILGGLPDVRINLAVGHVSRLVTVVWRLQRIFSRAVRGIWLAVGHGLLRLWVFGRHALAGSRLVRSIRR